MKDYQLSTTKDCSQQSLHFTVPPVHLLTVGPVRCEMLSVYQLERRGVMTGRGRCGREDQSINKQFNRWRAILPLLTVWVSSNLHEISNIQVEYEYSIE